MSRPVVLLVEDSADDVELAHYALDRCSVAPRIVDAASGEAALDYLQSAKRHDEERPLPDLVLLDLQLPGISGLEVVRRMRRKTEAAMRRMPIVMLTTSDDPRDVAASYDFGVNSYIRKPLELGEFAGMVEKLSVYWLKTNISPPA